VRWLAGVDENGAAHLLWQKLAYNSNARESYAEIMTHVGAQRSVHTIRAGGSPVMYASMAVGRGSDLALAYINIDPSLHLPPYHLTSDVFVAARRAGVWTNGIETYQRSGEGSFEPRMAIEKDGRRHLVWFQGTNSPTIVLHSKSLDGLTWSPPNQIASGNAGLITALQLLIDDNDRLHMIYQRWYGPMKSYYMTYRNGAWSLPAELPFGEHWNAAYAIENGKKLHAIFSGGPPANRSLYHTMLGCE
jgi:hypothetical protein